MLMFNKLEAINRTIKISKTVVCNTKQAITLDQFYSFDIKKRRQIASFNSVQFS